VSSGLAWNLFRINLSIIDQTISLRGIALQLNFKRLLTKLLKRKKLMIAITGATGRTGSKIANLLLGKGMKIRVIGRSEEKLKSLKERGAETAIGDQGDLRFLIKAFSGCDAVYLIIPIQLKMTSVRSHYNKMGNVAAEAICKSGVKKVVFLSSLGAELNVWSSPVIGLHDVEVKLRMLTHVDLVILRPGYYLEHDNTIVSPLKFRYTQDYSKSPYVPVVMIGSKDVAVKAAMLLETMSFTGHTVIKSFGELITYREVSRRRLAKPFECRNYPVYSLPKTYFTSNISDDRLCENEEFSIIEKSSLPGNGMAGQMQSDSLKYHINLDEKLEILEFNPVFRKVV
jgi:hypothetical protein